MAKQRKPKEDFVTIPQAPRYEINSWGVLRNRKTGYILKWRTYAHGQKAMALNVGGKKITVSKFSLLWLLHGKIKAKRPPMAVSISKGTRTMYFDSLNQCAKFLATVTRFHHGGVWYYLRARRNKIADWDIQYVKN